MSSINPGDLVRISAAFTDEDGDAADPTAVTVNIRLRRRGAETDSYVYGTDAEVEKDAVGNYHLDYTVPEISPDRGLAIDYEWVGTGAVQAVETGSISVSDPFGA